MALTEVGNLITTRRGITHLCLPCGCGGGRTLTLPPGPAVELGGSGPTVIPVKRWGRFTPPAAGGNRPGAPGLGDGIPRASYARLMSEGEGFGWLFGAWLGTVNTEGTTTKSAESNSKNKYTNLLYLIILGVQDSAKLASHQLPWRVPSSGI
jgi:hypothetical protein